MTINWFKYSSPAAFYPAIDKMLPWFVIATAVLAITGLYWGFFQTADVLSEQKQYYRIIFVHVPAAWMSMWLYLMLVGWSLIGLIFNTRLSFMLAAAIAPSGAIFTAIALVTGMIWGKTSWGTWWDWDPRMTSELILLFLYLGYMALQSSISDAQRIDRAASLLALVGGVCIPVIYWSVNCPDPNQCAALHQSSSLKGIEGNILFAMLIMALAMWAYSFVVIFLRLKHIILYRERNTAWVAARLGGAA